MTTLTDKIVALGASLDAARLPYAFGGALALAWCTGRARGTIDIDVNVFVEVARADAVVAALVPSVTYEAADLEQLRSEGQARLWWDRTPIDVFLSTTPFHEQVAGRARREQFAGVSLPFLACTDLAVFKVFFNRTKDWADVEEMIEAGTLDADRTLGVLAHYLGGEDERMVRLRSLVT